MHLLFTLGMTFYTDIGLLQNYLTLKQKIYLSVVLNTITEKASRKFCIENPVVLNCKAWIPKKIC